MELAIAGNPLPGWEYGAGTDLVHLNMWYPILQDLGASLS